MNIQAEYGNALKQQAHREMNQRELQLRQMNEELPYLFVDRNIERLLKFIASAKRLTNDLSYTPSPSGLKVLRFDTKAEGIKKQVYSKLSRTLLSLHSEICKLKNSQLPLEDAYQDILQQIFNEIISN